MGIIDNTSYILPKMLKKGDTIAFIAPAGPIKDKTAIERGRTYFEELGFNIIFSKHLFSSVNYLSDTDENRLEDLHNAFSDKDIDAIICARGGYGCLRLINKIDYNLIKSNPKIFCGYSDITVLSTMFLKKAGLITYSSPMVRSDFGADVLSDYTISNFFDVVSEQKQKKFLSDKIYKKGTATGILFGGNLASVVSLCGLDFIPDNDFIFFAEDLNEPVYKIDKMFTQLLNIDKFKTNIKGLILGDFLECKSEDELDSLFYEIATKLNIPVLGGFKITHNKDKITVPIGMSAKIQNDTLIF